MHIIGTILGAGGATFAEIFYFRSLKDKPSGPAFGVLAKPMFAALRVGMWMVAFSGFGYFLLFRFTGRVDVLSDPRMWMKMTLIVLIMLNAFLMQIRKMPQTLGTALSVVSWYAALLFGIWRSLEVSYLVMLAGYIAAVLVVAGVAWMYESYLKKRA